MRGALSNDRKEESTSGTHWHWTVLWKRDPGGESYRFASCREICHAIRTSTIAAADSMRRCGSGRWVHAEESGERRNEGTMLLSGEEIKARNLIVRAVDGGYRSASYDLRIGRILST